MALPPASVRGEMGLRRHDDKKGGQVPIIIVIHIYPSPLQDIYDSEDDRFLQRHFILRKSHLHSLDHLKRGL